jgi:hypothetical protein
MKQYYTGEMSFLIKKNYKYECDYSKRYYAKAIEHKKSNKRLRCLINTKTKEITYCGDMELIKYFENELEGKVKENDK